MKTRHIIAIALLSALAVGFLGFAISKTDKKPKTLQTTASSYIDEIKKPNIPNNPNNQYNITYKGTSLHDLNDYVLHYRTFGFEYSIKITYTYENNQTKTTLNYEIKPNYYTDLTNETNFENVQTHTDENYINSYAIITAYRIVLTSIVITNNTFFVYFEIPITYKNIYNQEHIYGIDGSFIINGNYSNYEQLNLTDIYCLGENQYELQKTIQTLNQFEQTNYTTGYNAGHTTGYNEGVAFGYDASALENPVDFAPMMLNILTMPFTFISQAFDVTLWPGTQYQINIGNFIKALLAISAILFIIKLFTSGFSIIGNYSSNIRNEQNLKSQQRQKNIKSKNNKQKNKKE